MPVTRQCIDCGTPLPEAIPGGLCIACALRGALARGEVGPAASPLEEESELASSGPTGGERDRCFGEYELLEEVARGGMGVVFKARQRSLNRVVAVKMMRSGRLMGAADTRRFQQEAAAAAKLQHPNIVAIHEAGEVEGQPFYSMDFVEGRSLAEIVREGPLSSKRAAGYTKAIAEAIHYAHEQGILHRDLKPSNVLIDAKDQPRITDFGLAKRFATTGGQSVIGQGQSEMTLTGQVLGSPNYLPPEQCGGRRLQSGGHWHEEHQTADAAVRTLRSEWEPGFATSAGMHPEVGPWSDVYGLGATLYHLTTDRPPFQAESLTTLLRQVIETEPVAPRLLNASIPRDLETICLKCLEKEPSRRYATAQAVADDLGRFLSGQPLLARPVGPAGKAWRWCRRKPLVAALATSLVLALLLGFIGVVWQWRRAAANELFARQNAYAADMMLAQRAVLDNDVGLALSLLDKQRPSRKPERGPPTSPIDLRHWEWRYLWGLCQGDESRMLHQYPDPVGGLAISKDGKVLVARTGSLVTLWDLATQFPVTELTNAATWVLALSPSGSLFAFDRQNARGEPEVEIWDVKTGKRGSALHPGGAVRSLAFSPDGMMLAMLVSCPDQDTLALVELSSNRTVARFTVPPLARVRAGVVVFSPDGRRLAIGEDYGELQVLNWRTGTVLPIQTETSDNVSALAFSPADDLIAAAFGYATRTIRLWDATSGEPRGQLTNSASLGAGLAFSPDGRLLAASSNDDTIRVWSVADRVERRCLREYQGGVGALAFLPDGRRLVSGGNDGVLRFWDLTAPSRVPGHTVLVPAHAAPEPGNVKGQDPAHGTLAPRAVSRYGFTFTPDGRSLLKPDNDGYVELWDLRSGQRTERLPLPVNNYWDVALSPDGRWLAAGDVAGNVSIWDWTVRRAVTNFAVPFEWSGRVQFSRSGGFLIAEVVRNDFTKRWRIWRTGVWEEVSLRSVQLEGLVLVDLSPDDRLLAGGYDNGAVRLAGFPAGPAEATFTNHTARLRAVLFSPDGRTLLSAGADGRVRFSGCVAAPGTEPVWE